MHKLRYVLRSLLTIGILLQLLYYFFFKEEVWLFFMALLCMATGIIYSMRQEWKDGRKTIVRVQLAAMGILLLFIGAVIAIKNLL